ncbi:MalY/PatB family protein [uncultured Bifidobacterium sp.]|uniref:MalY/PatB family protein n=1 Tax=uncultured Bifidobacterium sp. TaxID=165187 RepID=UPI00258C061F|nr:MalY/PatB family protein [uncultured Bifidobacterium sp.]MEE0654979.1 MalY/PatB family protein [Bifidobacterium criceti]
MFDFETRPERRHTTSIKWRLIEDELGEGHDDVIAMSVADMEFVPAPQIVDAVVDAARNDVFGYDYATDDYYDAVIGWMRRRHGLDIDRQWIRLSDGVMPAINTALRAFTHPGDTIVIQRPVYYPFTDAARNNGLTISNNALVYDDAAHTYTIDFDDLANRLADPRCTAMLLCNPHNPVGRVWTADELRRIGDLCIRHDVLLLVDEIHADFTRPGHPMTMFGTLGEPYASHAIEFTAPTKTFNLAGLLCSNAFIRDARMRERYDAAAANIGGLTVSHFGLVACIAAYNDAEAWFDALLAVLERNRAVLGRFALTHPWMTVVEPEGTYLAWVDMRGIGLPDADTLCAFMHERARVYCDEGTLFGPEGAGFERINLACPTPMLEEVLARIDTAVATLGE